MPAELVDPRHRRHAEHELAADAGLETGVPRRDCASIAGNAHRRTACGRPAIAASRSISSPTARCTSHSAPSPTNRRGWPGINIGGGYATFPGVVGTAVTKICATEVGAHRPQRARGVDNTASRRWPRRSKATTRAGYFPGARLDQGEAGRRSPVRPGARRSDRRSRRRGQAHRRDRHRGHGAPHREEMTALDLSYAPPFVAGVGPGAGGGEEGRRACRRHVVTRSPNAGPGRSRPTTGYAGCWATSPTSRWSPSAVTAATSSVRKSDLDVVVAASWAARHRRSRGPHLVSDLGRRVALDHSVRTVKEATNVAASRRARRARPASTRA